MGIRMNSLQSLAARSRLEPIEAGPSPTTPNQAVAGVARELPIRPAQRGQMTGNRAMSQAPSSNVSSDLSGLNESRGAGDSRTNTSSRLSRGADQGVASDPAVRARAELAPTVRDFRFLTVAQSARELELETRRHQLESRLENVNRRLGSANSVMTRVDARLERARLDQDLEMLSSEIRRLRLKQAFEKPAAPSDQLQVSGNPGPRNSSASAALNLLA